MDNAPAADIAEPRVFAAAWRWRWRAARPLVEAGPARQRCILVALLADASRVVPTDQLVDRVWGDRGPHRARETLRAYLSRLRHVLGVPIDRRAGSYVLEVDPPTVDLHRFRDLVARGPSPT